MGRGEACRTLQTLLGRFRVRPVFLVVFSSCFLKNNACSNGSCYGVINLSEFRIKRKFYICRPAIPRLSLENSRTSHEKIDTQALGCELGPLGVAIDHRRSLRLSRS